MSTLVEAVAGGIERMDAAQLAELLQRVAPGLEVRIIAGPPQHDPETHAVVPRRMTQAMIYSVRHDHWGSLNADRVLQELWRKAVAAAEREGA